MFWPIVRLSTVGTGFIGVMKQQGTESGPVEPSPNFSKKRCWIAHQNLGRGRPRHEHPGAHPHHQERFPGLHVAPLPSSALESDPSPPGVGHRNPSAIAAARHSNRGLDDKLSFM
jgi:hypothetical protein